MITNTNNSIPKNNANIFDVMTKNPNAIKPVILINLFIVFFIICHLSNYYISKLRNNF